MLILHLLVGVILFIAILTLIAHAERCSCDPRVTTRKHRRDPETHGSE